MIDIKDIAHSLANLCRFTGHTKEFYSVAKHSVFASKMVPQELSLQALLHDATEAYVGDLNSPLKDILPEFKTIETHIWSVIATKFGVPVEMDPLVKQADMALLHAESLKYLAPCQDSHLWDHIQSNYLRPIIPDYYDNSPGHWKGAFLERFEELTTVI